LEFQEKLRVDFHEEIKLWLNKTKEWSAGLITQTILNRLLGMCYKQAYTEALAHRKVGGEESISPEGEITPTEGEAEEPGQEISVEPEGIPVKEGCHETNRDEVQKGTEELNKDVRREVVEYYEENFFKEKVVFRGEPENFEEEFFENYAVEAQEWCSKAPGWYVCTDQSDYREKVREKCMIKAWKEITTQVLLWENLGLKPGEIREDDKEGGPSREEIFYEMEKGTPPPDGWGENNGKLEVNQSVHAGKTTKEVVEEFCRRDKINELELKEPLSLEERLELMSDINQNAGTQFSHNGNDEIVPNPTEVGNSPQKGKDRGRSSDEVQFLSEPTIAAAWCGYYDGTTHDPLN
jgi:hypothetical protein